MTEAIQTAVIGGLSGSVVAGLVEIYRLFTEKRRIRLAEMSRLRWEKRWEATAVIYGLLWDAFEIVKNYSFQPAKSALIERKEKTWDTCIKLDDAILRLGIFLPVQVEKRLRSLSGEFRVAHFHMSDYYEFVLEGKESVQEEGFTESRKEYYRAQRELVLDGKLAIEMVAIANELRQYLDDDDERGHS